MECAVIFGSVDFEVFLWPRGCKAEWPQIKLCPTLIMAAWPQPLKFLPHLQA